MDVDHYLFLGLPSGKEGSKLTEKEISKAYRRKSLEVHPDKRLDDPNASANFIKLQTAYDVLLRAKRQELQRKSQRDSKRQKMMDDLDERERSAFAYGSSGKARRSEEEIIAKKLKEEVDRIRAMYGYKMGYTYTTPKVSPLKKQSVDGEKISTFSAAEKETILKVSWDTSGVDYTAQRLRELFETISSVKDVVIRSSKKKRLAIIIIIIIIIKVAASGTVLGDYSNPLLVIPLQPAGPTAREPVKKSDTQLSGDLVGTRYQAFEDSVLQKLQKAAERQKRAT
ncbi:uncharacterized protein [Rutidosis leptorrhynchoides]|uniref:uncharacterized protein n=1 Tax=Rutidosis leptorrhynchoides TaxID=125765 RepID=UPI003A99BC52